MICRSIIVTVDIDPRTYKEGGGGEGCPKVFLSFVIEDKTLASDVFSSCSLIPRTVSMVTRYDVISSRWLSHFRVKVHFFNFFNNKSKSCGLHHAKCLFMCYYQAQKITISRGFKLISNSSKNPRWRPLLVATQTSSSATTHKIYPTC